MRIRFWRHRPERALRVPEPGRSRNERPAWATQPTAVFPTDGPGRAGNLTRAQRWRAGGWRDNGGPR